MNQLQSKAADTSTLCKILLAVSFHCVYSNSKYGYFKYENMLIKKFYSYQKILCLQENKNNT